MGEKSPYKKNISELEDVLCPCLRGLHQEGTVSSTSCNWHEGNISRGHFTPDCRVHPNIQCSESCAIHPFPIFVDYQSQHGHTFDLVESHIVHTVTPAQSIPWNLTLSKGFAERFSSCKVSESANYFGSTLECKSVFRQAKEVVGPSPKWLYASTKAVEKVRNLSNGSLGIHLADLQSKDVQISDLTRPPSISHTPMLKLKEGRFLGKRRFGSKVSDLTFISSSSSTCSCQSELSEYDLVSKGFLRCIWKDGLPYFVFSMMEDHGEVYIAKPLKMKTLSSKPLDYIYFFYSTTNARKRDRFNYLNHVVGKMTVSSCLSFTSNKSRSIETQFVLYDAVEDRRDIMSSGASLVTSKRFPDKLSSMFRHSNMNFHGSSRDYGLEAEYDYLLRELCLDEFGQLLEIDLAIDFNDGFLPSHELSAIVIRHSEITDKKEKTSGGWGLKFLETSVDGKSNQSHENFNSSDLGKVDYRSCRSAEVLIPAGVHGGPTTKVGGPSSLIERWRNGGQCDCGGWDIGCPITVLHDQPVCGNTASPMEASPGDLKLVDLFVEGAKQDEMAALRMVVLNEGPCVLSFQSKLSALQAFSIGVATIHSQAPALRPEL